MKNKTTSIKKTRQEKGNHQYLNKNNKDFDNNHSKIIYYSLLFLILISATIKAQTRVWYFGDKAGIKFNYSLGVWSTSIEPNSAMNTNEGCTSVTDGAGNVVFYGDGQNIWDANSTTPITSSLLGGPSSTQAALVVPVPTTQCSKFLMFTTPGVENIGSYSNGLGVSYISVSGSAPSYVVVPSAPQSLLTTNAINGVAEKLACTSDGNGGYWLVAHNYIKDNTISSANNNAGKIFHVYHITAAFSSITSTTSATALLNANHQIFNFSTNVNVQNQRTYNASLLLDYDAQGQMKFSRDGTKLALALAGHKKIEIYNFNPITGTISYSNSSTIATNPFNNAASPNANAYGLEFSPNGNYLYISEGYGTASSKNIYQMDLTSTSLTTTAIATNTSSSSYEFNGLQIGPDGKIYVAGSGIGSSTLSVISNPNNAGIACSFSSGSIFVGGSPGTTKLGLPTVISMQPSCEPPIGCATYADDDEYLKVGSFFGPASIPNQLTIWSNKVYVSGDVLVPSGYKLDITNCDVVFADCNSSISVDTDGEIECNNSTFRPCDLSSSWQGIYLYHNSIADIRECVFKNAFKGISLESAIEDDPLTGKFNITNNHFINNKYSIYLYNSFIKERITGNTFVNEISDEDNIIDWSGCTGVVSNQYYGIFGQNVTFQEGIATNDFEARYTGTKGITSFVGISLNSQQSSYNTNAVNINSNHFNNLVRAIDLFDITGGVISQNIINTSIDFDAHYNDNGNVDSYLTNYQNCSGLTIEANQFSSTTSKFLPSAMYFSNLQNGIIKDNLIKGLRNGINICRNSKDCNIASNDINCEGGVGIWLHENSDYNVLGCNQIKINYNFLSIDRNNSNSSGQPLDNFNGIGIYLGEENSSDDAKHTTIKGNCILDSRIAVAAKGNGQENKFINNFMYNYDIAGLYHEKYFTDLGTDMDGDQYSKLGRNSFISNRELVYNSNYGYQLTYDIFSNDPINAYGNYGVLNTNSNVTFGNRKSHHSKASCGLQITDNTANNEGGEDFIHRNMEDEYDYCDLALGMESGNGGCCPPDMIYTVSSDGVLTLSANYLSKIQNANDAMDLVKTVKVFDNSNLNTVINNIRTNAGLIGAEVVKYNVEVAIMLNDLQTANDMLQSVTVQDDYFTVKQIQVKYLINKKSFSELTSNEKVTLTTIVNKNAGDNTFTLAENILNVSTGNVKLSFRKADYVSIPKSDKWLSMQQPHILVYPNPSKNNISVEVVNSKSNTSRIEICNLLGEPIKSINSGLTMGVISFDISSLSSGVYLVNVYSDNKTIPLKAKFVKN